ncbi:MAG: helicase [Gemmatimonadetes bacterium]|nr:helicase [Gemmatimonadota bacterium]
MRRRHFRDATATAADGPRPAAVPPLAGVDGLDEGPAALPTGADPHRPPLRLGADAAERIRAEIARAGGREVCFLASVTPERVVSDPRAVARGNMEAVVAAARHDPPPGGVMIHNHPSGVLEPSHADLSVAARLFEEGVGTAITDNGATDLYVVVEPPEPRVRRLLDPAALEALVAPGGAMVAAHPSYEDRPGQRQMLRMVAQRYNDGGVAIVEAGTGTGKSLAYLVPAARWALDNDERTVVSTATINLQEQLVAKDLPLVSRLLGEDVPWALVKGRGNYVSIRRARLAAESAPSLFEEDKSAEVDALLAWMGETDDGSLSDLSFLPSDDLWEEVRSDPDICLRARCPHFQQCFYQKSRRSAASAKVLVANHHLLFTDLAVRRLTQNWTSSAVLPAYKHLVLDEAHNVEDAATSHMGVEVTRRGLYRLLHRLDRGGKGVLTALHEALAGVGGDGPSLRGRMEERTRPLLEDARTRTGDFLDAVEPLVPGPDGEATRIGDGEGALPEPAGRADVREAMEALLASLARLEREIDELAARSAAMEDESGRLDERILDLRSIQRRLAAAQHGIRLVLAPGEDRDAWVRWLEVRGRGRRGNMVLAAAPIDLGPILRDALFGRADTTVLSSATLATRGRFDFLRGRLGIDAPGLDMMEEAPLVVEAVVPSPFDFGTQTLLGVPTDLPDPREAGFQDATARVVTEVADRTGGGLFVLFTSHRALRRVAELLRAGGFEGRHALFVHGEDDRHRMLSRFVESRDGVLLGTASFWEGVDVPGDPLRGLVIQKLPFRVPTEPVTAARVEALERAGGNAFWEYMLPLAALRLKQGFGRLVRSRDDHGVVLLLDDRIVRRRYGAYLRESLPPAPLVKGPWAEVRRAVEGFYGVGTDP